MWKSKSEKQRNVQAPLENKIVYEEQLVMEGAKVHKEMALVANSRVDLEIPASPEKVVNFYKQAMTAKGWQPGLAMVQGPMGVLQLKKGARQITLKANRQKSIVNTATWVPWRNEMIQPNHF